MISTTMWRNWEHSRFSPRVHKYVDIANALSITITQLQDAVRQIETNILKRQRGAA